MINAATNVTTMDWRGWLRGIVGALISGGAGAVASGFGASMADPAHDISIVKVMAFTFLISGVVSMAKFLQITPVPAPVTISVPAPPNSPTQPTAKPS